jgi:uncharacterized protein (TIGR02246 family)
MKTRMKKLISISTIPVLALALLVVLGTVLADPAADEHRRDIAAIEEIWDNYALAMNTGDLELWMSLCTDDTIKMLPDEPAVFGKEDLRTSMEPLFNYFTIEIAIDNEEVQVAGRWAFSRGTCTVLMTPKAGGEPLYMDAKYLTILKRQAGGSWKIYIDCFNSNVPPFGG